MLLNFSHRVLELSTNRLKYDFQLLSCLRFVYRDTVICVALYRGRVAILFPESTGFLLRLNVIGGFVRSLRLKQVRIRPSSEYV